MGPLQYEVIQVLWQLEEAASGKPSTRPARFWASTFEIWEAFNSRRAAICQSCLSYATIWQILKRLQLQKVLDHRPKYCKGCGPPEKPKKLPAYVIIPHDDTEDPLPTGDEPEPEPPAAPTVKIRTWLYRTKQTRYDYQVSRFKEMRSEMVLLLGNPPDTFKALFEMLCLQDGSRRAMMLYDHLQRPCFNFTKTSEAPHDPLPQPV
jgi:Pyruvate/2-oxoacid:ferredoxin oxidoreductase delta subunit